MTFRPSLVLAAVLATVSLGAAEAPDPALTALLHQAQTEDPAAALARLEAWRGADHPLRRLLLGQQRLRLLERPGADGDTLRREATADFTAALAEDPTLRPAHLGLARLASLAEDWPTARRQAAAAVDPATAEAVHLVFLAETARRAGDHRLATLAAQTGILRFPDDVRLRRLELALLVEAGRAEDARQAVLALVAQAPQDTDLWRHLAWAAQATQRPEEALAALDAALATAPTDAALCRQVGEYHLAQGHAPAALALLAPLVDPRTSPPDLLLTAVRAATEADDLPRARAWLAAVPRDRRTRDLDLQDARLAVQAGDPVAAVAALDHLLAAGETDPVVLTWAGTLADQCGATARAEALLRTAIATPDHPATAAATLRLAALVLRQGRREEARTVVATWLARHPDDAPAKALMEAIPSDP